jgi:hypothetical protein
MYHLIEGYLKDIATLTHRYHDKRDTCINKARYTHGLQLCFAALKKAYDEIEHIYFDYALRPQIRLTQPIVISCIMCMNALLTQKKVRLAHLH